MRSICIIILNDKNDRNRMTMMITMTMMTVMLDTMMTMMMVVVVGIVFPRPWLESEEAFAKRLHLTFKALLYICKWNNN